MARLMLLAMCASSARAGAGETAGGTVGVADPKTDKYFDMCTGDDGQQKQQQTCGTRGFRTLTSPPASRNATATHYVRRFMVYYERFESPLKGKARHHLATMVHSHCSGSLISNMHVLSAGHCVCAKTGECSDTNPDLGFRVTLNYDPADFIALWVGLSGGALDMRYKDHPFIEDAYYSVSSVELHPLYKRGDPIDVHDICVLRLSRPVCSGPNLRPIALVTPEIAKRIGDGERGIWTMPYGTSGSLNVTWVYNGGYGITAKQFAKDCKTSRYGPAPFSPCKFPFTIKVPAGADPNCTFSRKVFRACEQDVLPPSFHQPECINFEYAWKERHNGSFEQINPAVNPWLSPVSFQVAVEDSKCTTQCYSKELLVGKDAAYSRYGWCATCDPNAKPGEPNSCAPEDAAVAAVASPQGNWGFCEWDCTDAGAGTSAIKAKFENGRTHYIADKKCKELLKENIDLENELCAAFLVVEEQPRYFLSADHTDVRQISFRKDPISNAFYGSADKSTYICKGDSGGPLWINWPSFDANGAPLDEGGKSYLVGVTRRADGCGKLNQPAIFGRISYYRKWLNTLMAADLAAQHNKQDKCNFQTVVESIEDTSTGVIIKERAPPLTFFELHGTRGRVGQVIRKKFQSKFKTTTNLSDIDITMNFDVEYEQSLI